MAKVLITGGAGFIGSYVSRHMVAQGHEVLIADKFDYPAKGRALQPILKDVRLLMGDLAVGDLAQRCAAQRPDWVVHMAANTHVDRAIADPESFMWSNVLGTTRLLQALWAGQSYRMVSPVVWDGQGIRAEAYAPRLIPHTQQIIIYSTDEVYGPTPPGVLFDESAPFKPSNAYSASKVGVEGVAHSFWVTHGMPIVVVRPCNTYAAGQHPEKAIPKFTGQMLRGEPVTLYNDGRGSRDWLHATDHARAIETLCEAGSPGEAYNLAAGEEHTDAEIVSAIREALGLRDVPMMYTPGRPGHDRRYAMDGTKLRALGWAPQVPFAEGLRETVQWTAAHQDYWQHDCVEVG